MILWMFFLTHLIWLEGDRILPIFFNCDIYRYMKRKNYYTKKKKDSSSKWIQTEGTNCDDIRFTNGEIEVDFDTWINNYYNK